jgi:hypothetical protein
MSLQNVARHVALMTIAASLAACSAAPLSNQVPVVSSRSGAGIDFAAAAAHGGERTAKGLRAFPAATPDPRRGEPPR